MKSVSASLALLSLVGFSSANPLLVNRAVCNADNCARAVTGTNAQPAFTSRQADCSSFQLATVTPVFTTTVTVSTFAGDTPSVTAAKRQATGGAITTSPTAVPTYASACSGTVRYSSACSCFGITKTTTTVATSTTTATVTATIVPGPRPVCGSVIQGEGPCACTYSVACNQKWVGGRIIATLNLLSETDCVNSCDHYDNCFNVDYSRTTGVCNIFQRADDSETVDDDDAFAFAGTCQSDGSNPDCVVG